MVNIAGLRGSGYVLRVASYEFRVARCALGETNGIRWKV